MHSATAAGRRIKVAVIASKHDRGSVTPLFDKPGTYAKYLSEELQYVYRGPLFCVQGTDRAGNRGSTTCAKLSVT